MKVLQLTQRFPPAIGGVENHVSNLATELTDRRVEVEVFTTDSARDIPFRRYTGDNTRFNFKVRRFHALKAANLPHGLGIIAPSMLPSLLSEPCDIVHAHSYGYFSTYAGTFVHRTRGVPLVLTTHSDPGRPHLQKRIFDAIVPELTLRQAQQVIAVTTSEARYLSSLGVENRRIVVIPNGINLAAFRGGREKSQDTEFLRILYVGRVYLDQKGLEILIRAASILPNSIRWRLDIVGEDWGGAAKILELAQKLKIRERVRILGRLDEAKLVDAYYSADVLVMPSLFEPFGIVLLEAMASGLPIVASNVGGVPEVVDEEKTGLLVEPGNPKSLAAALEYILSNESLRRSMGRAGRKRVSQFSWDLIVPKILKVYEQVIAENVS